MPLPRLPVSQQRQVVPIAELHLSLDREEFILLFLAMSVDINWETLTGGEDGQELAQVIRQFVHERFQQIPLPNLIRSVKVHAFDFGTVAPEAVLKDVCEPLPDFYESDEDDRDDGEAEDVFSASNVNASSRNARGKDTSRRLQEWELLDRANNPSVTRGAILGNTSNLGYFQLPGLTSFSGTTTPLAAVAGAHFHNGVQSTGNNLARPGSMEPGSPSSTASPNSRPVSRDHTHAESQRAASAILDGLDDRTTRPDHPEIERSPEDLQVVFHVTYSGDVRLSMTAEVFLDYPMPSFVGIPLKLNITGMTFNGVGILAYIQKRAHLCFLSPEDAEALVGSESAAMSPGDGDAPTATSKVGALLEEIKIESEMGEAGEGKQVLKNVGKIEKFILEQVQKIFEDEFVYPSFWTFLV